MTAAVDERHPIIRSVATAVPEHCVPQHVAEDLARTAYGDVLEDAHHFAVFRSVGVERRYSCVPPEWPYEEHSLAERSALYAENALRFSREAAARALDGAGVGPGEVGAVVFVSTTGLSTPSVGSDLIEELGLAPHARRVPVWGLGCAGGAAGLRLAGDLARTRPGELVLLVAAELCGLARRPGPSAAGLFSSALFADGAAAAVVGVGGEGPCVLGGHSTTWTGAGDAMGWRVEDGGLGAVLDPETPSAVRRLAGDAFEEACSSAGLEPGDVGHLVVHPGGAAVLDAYEDALGLGPGGLELSRGVLRDFGDMSSATVLFVLERMLERGAYAPGDHGIVSALGPGLSAEHALLRFDP